MRKTWISSFSLTCVTVASALLLSSAVSGCGDEDPVEEIEQVVDCAELCDRYQECRLSELDVSACTDRCEDAIEFDEAYRDAADTCEDCLDDRSCQEADDEDCWTGCPVFELTD